MTIIQIQGLTFLRVKSIFLLVIVAVSVALLGSILFQFFAPMDNAPQQIELEEKCEKIAIEGFQIQVKYTEVNFETMPQDDANRLRYLDDLWIRDCVSNLSPEKIFEIAQKAERDYYSGE